MQIGWAPTRSFDNLTSDSMMQLSLTPLSSFSRLISVKLVWEVGHCQIMGYLKSDLGPSEFDTECNAEWDSLNWQRTSSKAVPSSIPQLVKSMCAAASLLRWEFVVSICLNALQQLDQHHGSFTTLICFNSVMNEQSPLGAPYAQMRWT